MRYFIIFILVLGSLVLGACSGKEDASKGSNDGDTIEKQEKLTGKETGDKGLEKNQEGATTNRAALYDIQINSEQNIVSLVSPKGETIELATSRSTKPLKSPNGEKAAYLFPHDWEEPTNLYIVDLKDGSQTVLVSADAKSKPKHVIWEDDEHVLVIIGFPHGMIDVGGDIYRINIETKEKELIAEFENDIQVTYLLRIEDGVLYYSGIQYTDEEQSDYKDYANHIKLKK